MNELSGLSSQTRILSKPKATLEGISEPKKIEISEELKALKEFEAEIQEAFVIAQEIRVSLENTLKNLQ